MPALTRSRTVGRFANASRERRRMISTGRSWAVARNGSATTRPSAIEIAAAGVPSISPISARPDRGRWLSRAARRSRVRWSSMVAWRITYAFAGNMQSSVTAAGRAYCAIAHTPLRDALSPSALGLVEGVVGAGHHPLGVVARLEHSDAEAGLDRVSRRRHA